MSGYAFWDRLWEMHDETKELALFRPKSLVKHFMQEHVFLQKKTVEDQVDLGDEIEQAPAEHIERIKGTPNGVEEEEPREYVSSVKAAVSMLVNFFSVCKR